MERNIQKNGLVNALTLLLVSAAVFGVARYAGSLAGQVASVFVGLGFLVSFVSWFQMRLEESERNEKLELDEMARTKGGSTLFESKEAEIFPAQRSRVQFEKYFVPAFTVILMLVAGTGAWLLWRWLAKDAEVVLADRSMMAMALLALLALILFLLGRFSATIARIENHRLLKPGASYLLLGAYLCFVAALAIAGVRAEFPNADLYTARALTILLGVVAVETLLALIFEIYRPRVKGKVQRPLYDSRLVGLLGQPESLFTTAAHTLDYQFGFKVSETWFFQFFRERIILLIAIQLAVLFFSSCFLIVEPGEQALLERFGRRLTDRGVLGPGAHLKLPWPIDRAYLHPAEQIQTVNVGLAEDEDEDHAEPPVILWSVSHTKEDNFLVGTREEASVGGETTPANGKPKTPPVSLLAVSIPVQYQVADLVAWVYNHHDAAALLQKIAQRETVRFLVSVDFNEVLSRGRLAASEALRSRIQSAADQYKLGIKILNVGMEDIHPPVKVAPDYEKVVAARHRKIATILNAEAAAIGTNVMASGRAYAVTNLAESESLRASSAAFARAAAFTNQLPAFAAAPSVYMQRAYLQTFARATAQTPKYVLLATNTDNVFTFDLQEKIGENLMRTLAAPPKK